MYVICLHLDAPVVNYPEQEHGDTQSTTEIFKDMLNQKRNLLFSKLTSFDSDVSIALLCRKYCREHSMFNVACWG